MEDEGNTLVFSRKWGSYVENDVTGQMIELERQGDTYVMKLQIAEETGVTKKKKKVSWEKKGDRLYEKIEDMEVDGLEGDDDEGGSDEKNVVFRRRTLP